VSVELRVAESDADLAAHAEVWGAVNPRDPISVDFIKERLAREPERLYLLAEDEGRPIGCGVTSGSSFAGRKFVIVGVVPERRRRGLGSALLERCLEHARALGGELAISFAWEDCAAGLAFAAHHRFVEYERVVELVRELGDEVVPTPPAGIRIVELTPEHNAGAYEVWNEGVADIPSSDRTDVKSLDRWLEDAVLDKELVLVALDAGEVVGFAALEDRNREAGLAGNDLTTVRRSHRRRGIAEALKRTQLALAAERGYRRVITGTHEDNAGMRRVNEKLGYQPMPATIGVRRSLLE
jgi:predicted N-acetyltransferase YhbS